LTYDYLEGTIKAAKEWTTALGLAILHYYQTKTIAVEEVRRYDCCCEAPLSFGWTVSQACCHDYLWQLIPY